MKPCMYQHVPVYATRALNPGCNTSASLVCRIKRGISICTSMHSSASSWIWVTGL